MYSAEGPLIGQEGSCKFVHQTLSDHRANDTDKVPKQEPETAGYPRRKELGRKTM